MWRYGETPISNDSRFMRYYDFAGIGFLVYTGVLRHLSHVFNWEYDWCGYHHYELRLRECIV